MERDALVIGEACLDVDVYVGKKLVEQREVLGIRMVPGGSAGNIAYTASLLGIKTLFATAIGKDTQANILKEMIRKKYPKLETIYFDSLSGESCTVINIINRRGVRNTYFRLKPYFPKKFYNKLPDKVRSLILSGYTLELVNEDDVVSLLKKYGKAYKVLSLHPRASLMKELLFTKVLPEIDVIIGNIREYKRLFEIKYDKQLFDYLRDMEKPFLKIITLGSRGAIGIDNEIHRAKAVKPPRIESLKGAGDSFTAGFVYSLLRKMPTKKALEKANQIASHWISGSIDKANLSIT
jgi:sugar/nucleoside kinase (ribokinase family)